MLRAEWVVSLSRLTVLGYAGIMVPFCMGRRARIHVEFHSETLVGCSYRKGTCPKSDDLFGRSILVPIPSRLIADQENALAEAIRTALTAC